MVQVPKLEEQLLLSLLPQDEADQRDIVLEVLNHQAHHDFVSCSLARLCCVAVGIFAMATTFSWEEEAVSRPMTSAGHHEAPRPSVKYLHVYASDTSKPNLLRLSATSLQPPSSVNGDPGNPLGGGGRHPL